VPPLPGGPAQRRTARDTASRSDPALQRQPAARKPPPAHHSPLYLSGLRQRHSGCPGWCRGSVGNGPKGEGREEAALREQRGGSSLNCPSGDRTAPSTSYPPRAHSTLLLPAADRRQPPPLRKRRLRKDHQRLPPGSRPRTTAPGSPRGAERPPAQTTSPTMRRAT